MIFSSYETGQCEEMTLSTLIGEFTKRALKLISEWLELHKDGLRDNWKQAREGKELKPIEPLE